MFGQKLFFTLEWLDTLSPCELSWFCISPWIWTSIGSCWCLSSYANPHQPAAEILWARFIATEDTTHCRNLVHSYFDFFIVTLTFSSSTFCDNRFSTKWRNANTGTPVATDDLLVFCLKYGSMRWCISNHVVGQEMRTNTSSKADATPSFASQLK